jgi:HD-GYP domain-containing protein (c-di-GMP phosphodiesterase class II)
MMLAHTVSDRLRSLHDIVRSRYPAVERMALITYDRDTDLLRTFSSSSEDRAPLKGHEAKLAEVPSLAALARGRSSRLIDDIDREFTAPSRHTDWLKSQAYASSFTVPVHQGEELAGFLFFDARRPRAFNADTVAFLEVFSDLAVRLYLAERAAVRTLIGAVQLASQLGRVRDLETGTHLTRMAKYGRLIAREVAAEFALDDVFIEHLHLFAPLHDIGKVGIPDSILLKPGPLDEQEWVVMRTHVDIGLSMARHMIDDLGLQREQGAGIMLDVIGGHHERGDGSGYPLGLCLEDIPVAARILAVADVYDALCNRRPYKAPWDASRVRAELENEAASGRLDPVCVQALLRCDAERAAIAAQFADAG